jgi:hypothetical protein
LCSGFATAHRHTFPPFPRLTAKPILAVFTKELGT